MSVSLSPFLNVITGTENRNSQTSLNWNLDGPFQNVDNVAQHCEIHSKEFLKENVHNFGKKTRLNWNMDHSKYLYTIAQHCEIHSEDYLNEKRFQY